MQRKGASEIKRRAIADGLITAIRRGDPDVIFPVIERNLARVDTQIGEHASRLVGVGVAAPLWLLGWRDFLGAPLSVMDAWNEIDNHRLIQAMTALPVEFAKDTIAACVAELVAGE